ncbi:MAG TPA: MFS transporter [Candidatus Ligilactobacillus excrementipullorum]|nr:MFS transporter [Candidatus Ligilactobacillus excrementipullorum]
MLNFIKSNEKFVKIASINLFSKIGDRLFYTAMLSVAASLPQRNTAVMIVSISETLPVLLSFILGVIADQKKEKITLLVHNSLVRALLYFLIGYFLQYRQTLLLVFCLAAFNLLSDIAGNYSSALFVPFTKILVRSEDMEQAQGIVSVSAQLVNVIATFMGSILLTLMAKGSVAYLNAGVFLIVTCFYWVIHPSLKKAEKQLVINPENNSLLTIKENIDLIEKNTPIFAELLQLALLNGFFGGLTPIFVLFMQESMAFKIISAPIAISLLTACITLFMICGNLLSPKMWRNITNQFLEILASICVILVGISFYANNIWLIYTTVSLVALFLGIISPRFSAKIINNYPLDRLGGIVTTVNSLLVILPPLTSFIFPLLSGINLKLGYLGMLIYGGLLLLLRGAFFRKSA